MYVKSNAGKKWFSFLPVSGTMGQTKGGCAMANKKLKLLYLARYLREELPKLV